MQFGRSLLRGSHTIMLHKVFLANKPAPVQDTGGEPIDPRVSRTRFFSDTRGQRMPSSVEDMKKKSKKVLLNIKTVFPFKFFPTHLIVDIHRVIVIEQTFLFADTIRSIPIQNIQYVRCDRALLFGSLCLRTYGFSDREVVIKHLWNKDAVCARRIIEGLLICYEDNLDPMKFGEKDICKNLQSIGREYAGESVG